MTTEPEFVVVGTGRSGSAYIAAVLSNAGLHCGHERWWNPDNDRTPGLIGDSSWLAVPHLGSYSGHILHQTRHPLKVLRSLWNGEIKIPGDSPYLLYMAQFTKEWEGNWRHDTTRFVTQWLEEAETHSELTWRLEGITSDLIMQIGAIVGHPVNQETADAALATVATNLNQHRVTPDISWDDLPQIPEAPQLRELAARFGYPN